LDFVKKSIFPQRILVVSGDSHLAMALQLALEERGYTVRCERNSRDAIGAIKEFSPDTLITACDETVFIGRRNAAEIVDLPRPLDTDALLRLLQTVEESAESLAM
jgi:PleD family two-component response regulator